MNTSKRITEEFLRRNPNVVFVYGDNLIRKGKGGAAKLRDEPNTYGFITKKYPNNNPESFYKPDEYRKVFEVELAKLLKEIELNPNRVYLISKIGAGLANQYGIYDKVIVPGLAELKERGYKNVIFL